MKKLQQFLNNNPGMRILDVGTGSGGFIHLLSYLSNDYQEMIGIDINERALEAAKKNFDDERIKFYQMDALNMTFEDNSFDVVCISNSLHHIKDVKGTIDVMKKIMKPNGKLLISEMYSDVDDPKRMTHVLMHHFWGEIDTENGIEHRPTYTRQGILNLIKDECQCDIIEAWDMIHEDEHVLTDDDYKFLNNGLDQYLKKVKNDDKREYYEKLADDLRTRLKEVGFLSATELLIIAE